MKNSLEQPKLSFYTFAKNLDASCLRTISNVYDYVDELIVILSNEFAISETLKVPDLQKKVKFFYEPFRNYAQMRNFALAKVTGKWVLALDSDETLSTKLLLNLRKLITDQQYTGYKIMRIHYYQTKNQVYDPFLHLRLFKLSPIVKYVGQVHELLMNVKKISKIMDKEMVIFHFNTLETMIENNKKYYQMLMQYKAAATKYSNQNLVDLADFLIWCNQNIDNPLYITKRQNLKRVKTEYQRRLKLILNGRKHYHDDLAKLNYLLNKQKN